jgi:RNA-binding protein 25
MVPVAEDDSTQHSLSEISDIVTPKEEVPSKPMGFTGLRIGGTSPTPPAASDSPPSKHSVNGKRKKLSVGDVFNQDDDESGGLQGKKKKLATLDDDIKEGSTAPGNASQEEKRKNIKSLIDKIPTEKEKLFAYTVDWSLVDSNLMERRIKPWINKKIVEYIGEEEPSLVEFICSKVLAHSLPPSILDDVQMVLDDEAEVFVVKMWRLLIYEIEAKKLGLASQGSTSSRKK